MEETQHKPITPQPLSEEQFAAFLKAGAVEELLSPVGYVHCAEGLAVPGADYDARIQRLTDAARSRQATQEQLAGWMQACGEMELNWQNDPESVRSIARGSALQTSPLQTIAEVEPREVEYLAEPYLPRGEITLLAGLAGQGKTTLALWLASQVSNGDLNGKPGVVFYFTKENDASVVLRPRLEAMGAQLDKIVIPRSDAPQMTMGDPALAALTNLYGYKPDLIVFDPVQSYLDKRCDMNRIDDVRHVLDRLNAVARAINAAVLLVCHIRKIPVGFNGAPSELITGSSDFVNTARSVCFLGRDPANPDVCVVAQEKNSLGVPGASLTFTIADGGTVQWCDEDCDLTAQELMTYSTEKRRHAERPGERALRVLREILQEKEKMASGEVLAACAERGVNRATIYRVRDKLNLHEERSGKVVFWSLPVKQNVSQIPIQEKNEK